MLLVPALLLSGCVPSWLQGLVSGGTVSTPTGEEVADDVRSYYSQVLTWTGCGGGAECATATCSKSGGRMPARSAHGGGV